VISGRSKATVGVLHHSDIQSYLASFPNEFRTQIADMLEKLEIAYALPDAGSNFAALLNGQKEWYDSQNPNR